MNDDMLTDVACEVCGHMYSITGLVKEPFTCKDCQEYLEEQNAVDF